MQLTGFIHRAAKPQPKLNTDETDWTDLNRFNLIASIIKVMISGSAFPAINRPIQDPDARMLLSGKHAGMTGSAHPVN
jgi:hypothetical protein